MNTCDNSSAHQQQWSLQWEQSNKHPNLEEESHVIKVVVGYGDRNLQFQHLQGCSRGTVVRLRPQTEFHASLGYGMRPLFQPTWCIDTHAGKIPIHIRENENKTKNIASLWGEDYHNWGCWGPSGSWAVSAASFISCSVCLSVGVRAQNKPTIWYTLSRMSTGLGCSSALSSCLTCTCALNP